MHGERHTGRMSCLASGTHDRGLYLKIITRAMDEPHLDVVSFALELTRHERARLVGAGDADDRGVAEIELWPVDHRYQRAGNDNARGRCGVARLVANVEI